MAYTHTAFGVLFGLAVFTVSTWLAVLPNNAEALLGMIIAAAIGALVPDLDHTGSYLGRRLRIVSFVIHTIFGHRTMTHSLLGLGLFTIGGFALLILLNLPLYLLAGFFAGVVSHLVSDAMTPSGIPLYWPFSKERYRLSQKIRIPTGSSSETLVFFLVFLLVIALGWMHARIYLA